MPFVRLRTSQLSAAGVAAVQLSAAPLFIPMVSDCDGSVAPLTPEKVRLLGLGWMAGAETVSVTLTGTVPPAVLNVTEPL